MEEFFNELKTLKEQRDGVGASRKSLGRATRTTRTKQEDNLDISNEIYIPKQGQLVKTNAATTMGKGKYTPPISYFQPLDKALESSETQRDIMEIGMSMIDHHRKRTRHGEIPTYSRNKVQTSVIGNIQFD